MSAGTLAASENRKLPRGCVRRPRAVMPRSVCNVSATSQETLQGHAAGMKHKRRVRLCLGASSDPSRQSAACACGSTRSEQCLTEPLRKTQLRLFQHGLGALQVKAIEKAAQPAQGSAAVESGDAKAGDGAKAGGGNAVVEPTPLANGSSALTAAVDGPTANGSAVAAPKRKRSEAAITVSAPANGAAAPSEQQRANKPRKKSKATAAGSDTATDDVATEANGVASPSAAEVAKKRKKVLEPTADAAGELAARVGSEQSGKKARRKSKEEARSANGAGGTATEQQDETVTSAAAEHGSSQTPKQTGESRRLKPGAMGSQKQGHKASGGAEASIPAPAVIAVKGSAADVQQSMEQHGAARQQMTTAGLTPPNAESRKAKKAAKACLPYDAPLLRMHIVSLGRPCGLTLCFDPHLGRKPSRGSGWLGDPFSDCDIGPGPALVQCAVTFCSRAACNFPVLLLRPGAS